LLVNVAVERLTVLTQKTDVGADVGFVVGVVVGVEVETLVVNFCVVVADDVGLEVDARLEIGAMVGVDNGIRGRYR